MIEIINAFARRKNCIIGICDATPLPHRPKHFTPFVSQDIHKRANPSASLQDVKSIIVIGVEPIIPIVDDFPPMPDDAGVLSILGVAKDYHIVVKALLKKLADELQQHTNYKYKILVDSGTLDERALAVRAGLGFIGRSGLVISQKFGSRFNIGLLLTTIPLKPSKQSHTSCQSNCHNCIKACPTGALSATSGIDATRCISYLTQKDNLTPDEAVLIGNHLYGCDICQNVCPHNRPAPTPWVCPKSWLSMNDIDFEKAYSHTAMMWRGTEILRRNARHVARQTHKALPQN